jgi:hypothetical protein
MSGQGKNWSDIYQFFSDNGQSKIFHIFLKISTMFLLGHVSPQCNASKTEYIYGYLFFSWYLRLAKHFFDFLCLDEQNFY